jgi:hypothetical protein
MTTRLARNRSWMGIALLLAAGCSSTAVSPSASTPSLDPGEGAITIESGTQASIGELRIGSANIREEEYTTADGQAKRGLTAGLWFSTSEAPADPPMVRVHPGQVLEVRRVRIRVLDIGPANVQLAVLQLP